MAKKSVIQRNLKRMQICYRYRSRRQELKDIINNKSIPIDQKFVAQLKLSKMPRDSSAVRIRNRCLLTCRSRGVYRELRISTNNSFGSLFFSLHYVYNI